MRKGLARRLVVLGVVAGAASVSPAQDGYYAQKLNENGGYYDRKEEGWFWKKDPPVALEPLPEVDPEQPPDSLPAPPEETPPAGPAPLSSAWLRENLPEYRDRALDDPSDENVRAYMYLQRYAMDMAERFAFKTQAVVLSDPILDENTRRPLSTYGARVADDIAEQATVELASKIAQTAGVWYFYRSDCPYCKAQNPILERLERSIGLAILPIAIDGRPMPDGAFPEFVTDRGHAAELGVTATPTLYLVRKPNEFVVLSEGLVTDNSIMQRMIVGAHEAGWISDAEFNATRPVRPYQLQAGSTPITDEILDDPVELVELLRARVALGYE